MKHIVILVGSLRKDSFNKQLATIIKNKLQHIHVEIINLNKIPFFNEDEEFPTPIQVKMIRNAIKKADGIWIISPEYNGEIPGVLKNALDWLSRPENKNDWETGSVLKNKAVTISSVAGRSKGLHARTALSKLLQRLGMNNVYDLGTGFSFNQQVFVLSKEDEELLQHQIQTFIEPHKNS